MVLQLPAALASTDIRRFAVRASQLEKFKPVVAYWCDYYLVNKILERGLHTENDETMTYTTTLMDKLEQIKADQAGNDAIHDDMAAQAYVEQFAQETFQRAEGVMKANKVTAQTADTLTAAGTFLDLLAIWQKPLDQEVAAKSKYAKFHALRIAKALKAGEDPNASNPTIEPEVIEPPPLDPNDPEVRQLQSPPPVGQAGDVNLDPASFYDVGGAKSVSMTSPPAQLPGDVSPLEQSAPHDGYFPNVASNASAMPPTFTADNQPSAASAGVTAMPTASDLANSQASNFTTPSIPSVPQLPPSAPMHPQIPPSQSSSHFGQPPPSMGFASPQPPHQPAYAAPPPAQSFQSPMVGVQPSVAYRTDDDAVSAAQKHAKWAISALNFEDVPTAVKELTIALQALGAR